ncbi:unnamed protein product, partial [Rotaria sp. Silwood2]
MNQSDIDLLDLPNEILLIILKKLDNIDVLYSLFGINNKQLDILVEHGLFTNILNFVRTPSINDIKLDRFCTSILPRIHHSVKKLIVETTSMKRILLAGDYPNLTSLELFNFGQEVVCHYFTDYVNQFADVPLQNGGDTSWQGEVNATDQAYKRQNKPRSTKPQDFQIRIKIFQARQLDGSNLHSVCRVRVVGSIKQIKIQKGTNQSYFNEVFFFNINMSEAELCDEMIEFEVCNSRTLRADMKIGSFIMDIGYIYSQAKHSINRKWLLLSDEDDRITGAKGYLKVSVNILGPADEAPSQENAGDDNDIEMDSTFLHGVKKIFHATEDIKELIDPYVSLKIVYTFSHPEFNQEVRLGLKFPSMCDKITLTVMDWDRLQFDDVTGSALHHINRLCDDRENGIKLCQDRLTHSDIVGVGIIDTLDKGYIPFSPKKFFAEDEFRRKEIRRKEVRRKKSSPILFSPKELG